MTASTPKEDSLSACSWTPESADVSNSQKTLDDLFQVNVYGAVRTIKTFLPLLRKSNAGARVVINGSIAGFTATPLFIPYSMSKHAIEALASGLRSELAVHGISVSLLEPGPVETLIISKNNAGITYTGAKPAPITLNINRDQASRELAKKHGAIYKLYFRGWAFCNNFLNMIVTSAVPYRFTSRAVVHATTSGYPLSRYTVTFDAYLASAITNSNKPLSKMPSTSRSKTMSAYPRFLWSFTRREIHNNGFNESSHLISLLYANKWDDFW